MNQLQPQSISSKILFFKNFYLTRQVNLEQILIYNDGLPRDKRNPVGTKASSLDREVSWKGAMRISCGISYQTGSASQWSVLTVMDKELGAWDQKVSGDRY